MSNHIYTREKQKENQQLSNCFITTQVSDNERKRRRATALENKQTKNRTNKKQLNEKIIRKNAQKYIMNNQRIT